MSSDPAVSVITPTKNRLKLLCETIDSVQRQTFEVWEHVIVDDGSDDGTAEEVARRAVADPRIRYLQRTGTKSGANICRNLGIRQARADLLVFLDLDDLLRSECLERRIETMRQNRDLDFAVFRAGVFRNSVGDLRGAVYHPQSPGDDLLRFLSFECPWQSSGPIWCRSFLERIGGFNEALLSMQDLEMHVRAISTRGKYLCFPNMDHDIRGHDDASKTSVRHFNDPNYIGAVEDVRVKLLHTVSSHGLLTWSRRRALIGISFGAAESWVRVRQLTRALQTWRGGCRHQQAPWHLQIMGCLMLCALRLSRGEGDVVSRAVNKWKGWVRFRQEPALLKRENETSATLSYDEAS